MAENFYDKVTSKLKAGDNEGWTPLKTFAVAGGIMIVLGIVTVIVIKAKKK